MRPAARLSAAIEVLADISSRNRPASEALKTWGLDHRFAGSADRAVIGNMVFDALRHRASIAWAMDDDEPRPLALGVLRFCWDDTLEHIEGLCAGAKHGPSALTHGERTALAQQQLNGAPNWVQGDYPEWLEPDFHRAFGENAVREGRALAARAPVDLRVNTLKSTREKVLSSLKAFDPHPAALVQSGVRIAAGERSGRSPNLMAEPGYRKGWFEIQDEGSQLTAAMCNPTPGEQVVDVCAGAGGKTLALSALMENKGQIFAYDADRHRLAEIWTRLKRAGCRNVQVLKAGDLATLESHRDGMDLVLIDAPCSGSGAWRRRPDAKWRFARATLDRRLVEQRTVLELGAGLVKRGGRLAYVTCSMLGQENEDQASWFLEHNEMFAPVPVDRLWRAVPGLSAMPGQQKGDGILLTPSATGTDGFYICCFERSRA